MNKSEYGPYLRKLALREKLALTTEPNPEAARELDDMDKSSESEEKDLTTPEEKV